MIRRIPVLVAVSVLAGAPFLAATEPKEFSFAKLNRTYTDLVSDFEPIEKGAMTLTLSSPKQSVVLASNKTTLTPREDGIYDARVLIEFSGGGMLAGDVEMGGQGTRMQDEFTIPPQVLDIPGKIKVKKGETGYVITAVALPAEIQVTVKSGIAARFVTWCDRLALVPFTNLDCEGFERSMTEIRVPMPAAGETYVLPFEELSAEERAALEGYLGLD